MAIRCLEADVGDREPRQIELWGVDQAALVAKVRAMSIAERIAVAETVERWWRAEGDQDERLGAAGVEPT